MSINSDPGVTITAVERDTGLSKDTLRAWERRYGFPKPMRDAQGDRLYPPAQVRRLQVVLRLIEGGLRPGQVVGASDKVLAQLMTQAPARAEARTAAAGQPPRARGRPRKPVAGAAESGAGNDVTGGSPDDALGGQLLAALRSHDLSAVRGTLAMALAQQGLQAFVLQSLPRANTLVGQAWVDGRLAVFEEHLYTEQVKALLRQAMGALPPARPWPAVLLTTVPGEHHGLGLLMVEALCALQGLTCIALGTQTPLDEILAAVAAHKVDAVLLSFSAAFPQRQLSPLLTSLRQRLPSGVQLWAGGAGVRRAPALPGVSYGHSLADALALLQGLHG